MENRENFLPVFPAKRRRHLAPVCTAWAAQIPSGTRHAQKAEHWKPYISPPFPSVLRCLSHKHYTRCGRRTDSRIQRKEDALAASTNRAKPSAGELISIFEGHIAAGTLVLCDGLRSYHALPGIADCTVKDCTDPDGADSCFYNLNTVNGFHSYIKQRYVFYRRVAIKYINRYNALFSTAYRNAEGIIRRLVVTGMDYFHSNKDVREVDLLAIWALPTQLLTNTIYLYFLCHIAYCCKILAFKPKCFIPVALACSDACLISFKYFPFNDILNSLANLIPQGN